MADVTARARGLVQELADWNDVLSALRAEGFSKIECVRATAEVRRLPLGESKRLVHESEAWRDLRERDDLVLDDIVEGLEELGGEVHPPEDV